MNIDTNLIPGAYYQIHNEQGWAVVDNVIVQRPAHRTDETADQIAEVVAQYQTWLADNPR